ncbi:MAG: pyridoxamine 5'-phosphate oxidase family protein, partial [Pseudomonadota bacterium]
HKYAEIAFTPKVKAHQHRAGSRAMYAAFENREDMNHRLGRRERDFIGARDSFYFASVSQEGWPYVQHRGGPRGFVKVLDDQSIGFADFKGNRQFITAGNIEHEERVSLLFMDYANRRRLKMFGRAQTIHAQSHVARQLATADYQAQVESAVVIEVVAFDWNCPQHITPRLTAEEWRSRQAG